MSNWLVRRKYLGCCGVVLGCGSSVPLVPVGPHPATPEGAIEVDTFPPPAKVEVIPLRRTKDCLWQDGFWEARPRLFGAGQWSWQPGRWVHVPDGCYYAPPHTDVEKTATRDHLLFVRGAYYSEETKARCTAPSECE